MEVRVRGRNVEVTDALRAHVERHLQFALSRFGERVRRVTVRLMGIDGPSESQDQICFIELTWRPAGRIVVKDVNHDLHAAIYRATERVGRAVSRVAHLDSSFDGAAAGPQGNKTR